MGMAATLFDDAEPLEQIVNTLSADGPMWNLVKSEQETFKKYTVLYMYIAKGQGQITPEDKFWL